jgi:hypothetical protein
MVSDISGAPPTMGQAPTGAVSSGESPWVVRSAWVTVYRCGGELEDGEILGRAALFKGVLDYDVRNKNYYISNLKFNSRS